MAKKRPAPKRASKGTKSAKAAGRTRAGGRTSARGGGGRISGT